MLHRKLPALLGFAIGLALVSPALRGATTQMAVSDIRPGMVGIGHTVFDGTHVEEFKAHILGVLENVIGAQRNLILARLEGGPLANTGVIAGMSGSPVYIDGRLIGAVSYALGSFSKEPIAGITPIAEMTDATTLNAPRPAGSRVHLEYPLTRENLTAAFRKALNWNRPFADRPGDAQLSGVSAVASLGGGQLGTLLRPIATPLVMSGFEPEIADLLGSAFREQGFIPMGGNAAGFHAGEMPFEGPLKPGDGVGVMLVSGDLMLGATGTVTHIDGDRVYAFGHPMYNLGPTEFPMTRAYTYTVLPSLFSSMKLSSTGEIIGTVLQDRATAIAGRLGPGPRMLPVTLSLESNRRAARTFHFGVVNDPLFGPLMTYAGIQNTLGSYERQFEAVTLSVRGTAKVKNHDAIAFENLFSGEQASAAAAAYIVAPITYLLGNDYEKVELEGVDVTISTTEAPKTATLERVWLDDPRPRAGRQVPLKVMFRTYRGEEVVRTVPIAIPANASGSLSLLVSDGNRLGLAEQREARTPLSRSVDQMIKSLNKGRRNNTLYVKLLGSDAGAVVNGELLSSLPPSVLGVLEGDRNGGSFNPLHSATLGEWELTTEHAVSGARTLTITVSQN
ncbi:MAG TPA: SpoIVB peptidase S55 domain-containing protein [Vicinamibacterales bacterium]|nr:SpoIVB peptidase S55 domain-containing protein [Vicinamibacterales bacterium]